MYRPFALGSSVTTRFFRAFSTSILSEPTPNPEAVVFWVDKGRDILGVNTKSLSFANRYDCKDAPLASALFKVQGVHSILLGPRHVTVTKSNAADWVTVKPNIELVLSQFFDSGFPVVNPAIVEKMADGTGAAGKDGEKKADEDDDIMTKLLELLEERVRPFVQQDGGDVEFVSFDIDEGLLKLRMQGSCSGCPKSQVTLKLGIQRMLQYYIPEIRKVENVGDAEQSVDPSSQTDETTTTAASSSA